MMGIKQKEIMCIHLLNSVTLNLVKSVSCCQSLQVVFGYLSTREQVQGPVSQRVSDLG